MDIYLTPAGGSTIRFPMLPEQIEMAADAKYMQYSLISLGDVKIPRGKGIKEIQWSGIFPGATRIGSQLIRQYTNPDDLIQALEKARDEGTSCTLLVPGTVINYKVYISRFKGKYSGGSGDFFYEIKFIVATEIKIYTTEELKIKTPSKREPAQVKTAAAVENKSNDTAKTMTYTAKLGDSMWGLAQKYLGNGGRFQEIANLNPGITKKYRNPYMVMPGDVLTIPLR